MLHSMVPKIDPCWTEASLVIVVHPFTTTLTCQSGSWRTSAVILLWPPAALVWPVDPSASHSQTHQWYLRQWPEKKDQNALHCARSVIAAVTSWRWTDLSKSYASLRKVGGFHRGRLSAALQWLFHIFCWQLWRRRMAFSYLASFWTSFYGQEWLLTHSYGWATPWPAGTVWRSWVRVL